MNLGEKIKNIRQNKKISQKILAEKVGISRGYLVSIENGRKPSTEVIFGIADALSINPNVLLSDDIDIQEIESNMEKMILQELLDLTIANKIAWEHFDEEHDEYEVVMLLTFNEDFNTIDKYLIFRNHPVYYYLVEVDDENSLKNQSPDMDTKIVLVIIDTDSSSASSIEKDQMRLRELYDTGNPNKTLNISMYNSIYKNLKSISEQTLKNESNNVDNAHYNCDDDDDDVPF